MESEGIMMFNRGDRMMVNLLVSLYSLRKHYGGNVTVYLENPCSSPLELDESLKHFGCDIIHLEDKHEFKTLVRKNSLFANPPYDKTLWLDSDTIIMGSLQKMFDYLDEKNVDMCIPHFCGWVSDGHTIAKRINRFKGIIEERYIKEALKHHPAINTGVLSFRKSENWAKFVKHWTDLAHQGAQQHVFIPDETVAQVLYPSMHEWGLKYFIAPTDYNMSVLHDHGNSKDPRIIHYHGKKSVLDVATCQIWKDTFEEMCKDNIANINCFLQYADKRLKQYLMKKDGKQIDTTIVTACDEYYVDILRLTFANWRKYKKIDGYPVIVFVHGMDVQKDPRLDFLRLPNVQMIPWKMENAENHREEMLSAFVFGTAEHVKTDYWLKLDADSYATNDTPFITEKMKQYAFCGHKWGYTKPYQFIEILDNWAKKHWKRKLRKAPPMINEGRIEGRRFYHNVKRTISYIQLHRTKFTRFCVKLLREKKLPAPTQDTFFFYVCNRFDPQLVGIMNFKKQYGFTQGRGKLGAEHIKKKLAQVEEMNREQAK